MGQIRLEIVRVAEILRGDEFALDEVGPGVGFEEAVPGLAEPVGGFAGLEFADAVVLAAEGDEVGYRRRIAAFDVGAEELAALGEAEGVDGGGEGEGRVGGEVVADLVDLVGQVAEEGGGAVGGRVVVEADDVGVGGADGFIDEGADGGDAVRVVAMGWERSV